MLDTTLDLPMAKQGIIKGIMFINMVKISLVLPIYNVEKYLEGCLDSICKQSYKDFEVILIDDGSTDRSAQIIKK